MSLAISSSAFADHQAIPQKYTCEGEDVSPPLHWSGAPQGTKSFALIVDDPDAPDPKAPRTTWVHWIVYDLPAGVHELGEGIGTLGLPEGARQGINDWKRAGYGGPCPPIGRHRYFHKLYALDVALPKLERPTKAQLLAAMKGHVLAEAQLVGTYEKSR
jgi:Raf kinase inhibitor-like YbhB/YbcL family protein